MSESVAMKCEWIEVSDRLPELGEYVIVGHSKHKTVSFAKLVDDDDTEDEFTVSWMTDCGDSVSLRYFTQVRT